MLGKRSSPESVQGVASVGWTEKVWQERTTPTEIEVTFLNKVVRVTTPSPSQPSTVIAMVSLSHW